VLELRVLASQVLNHDLVLLPSRQLHAQTHSELRQGEQWPRVIATTIQTRAWVDGARSGKRDDAK
jgi:hypothetical protein